MKHFTPIAQLDVWPFGASLFSRRHEFDRITLRQDVPGSPHKDTRSIFLRLPEIHEDQNPVEAWFADVPHWDTRTLQEWPEAQDVLKRISMKLEVIPQRFGKVMVIELKPGGALAWHRDEGAYAEKHDRYHLPIVTNPGAQLYAGVESAHLQTGLLCGFDNTVLHSAVNHGDHPRVHLVVDVAR